MGISFHAVRKIAVVVLAVCVLSACTTPQQRQQAAYRATYEQAKAISKECAARHASGELKTAVATIQCSSGRIIQAWDDVNFPYMDLIRLEQAALMQGAENIDAGKVTPAEAQMQIAELDVRIQNEGRRRDMEAAQARNQAAYADAATRTSYGSLLQGLAALQPKPPSIKSTTCNGIGSNMVNCTTTGSQ